MKLFARFFLIFIALDDFLPAYLFATLVVMFDRSAIGRNRLSINTRALPSFDKLRRDF